MDDDLIKVATGTAGKVIKKMERLRVADAITEIFALFKRCNKYIDETAPWVLAKNDADMDRLNTVLYNLCECISIGATLLAPFMPSTSEKILKQLNTEPRKFYDLERYGLYASGTKVTDAPEILFARLDADKVMAEVEARAEAARKEAIGPVIDIGPEAEIGSEVKQIVSGIKSQYSAEEMVGKEVMVLVNLKPAKLAGVLSEGMLLCAENDKGELSLMVPEKKMLPGAEIC